MNKKNLFNLFSLPSLTPSPSPKGEGSIKGQGGRLLLVLAAFRY